MESFEYLEISIENMLTKSENALQKGNVSLAKQFNDLAIKQIKKIIEIYPNNSSEYKNKLNEIQNKEFKNVPQLKNETINNIDNREQSPNKTYNNDDKNNQEINISSLQESLNKLDSLIGLNAVKKQVKSWINTVNFSRRREDINLKKISKSYHLVFSGNPGTGKTTVARIIADICKSLGIVSKGHLIEVSAEDLVAEYVGQTAIKTKKVIDSALGGVLFIDEAYSLNSKGNTFGEDAINTLLRAMENNREDFIVIVAGYKDEMKNFISSNPGLNSRFQYFIEFEDYNAEELYKIFEKMCSDADMKIELKAQEKLKNYFINLFANRSETFGNGRDVRKFFEKTLENMANRLGEKLYSNVNKDELSIITCDDIITS